MSNLLYAPGFMVAVTVIIGSRTRRAWNTTPRKNQLTLLGIQLGCWLAALGFSFLLALYWASEKKGIAIDGRTIYNASTLHQMELLTVAWALFVIGFLVLFPAALIRSYWTSKRFIEREHHARREETLLDFPSS